MSKILQLVEWVPIGENSRLIFEKSNPHHLRMRDGTELFADYIYYSHDEPCWYTGDGGDVYMYVEATHYCITADPTAQPFQVVMPDEYECQAMIDEAYAMYEEANASGDYGCYMVDLLRQRMEELNPTLFPGGA